METKEIKKYLVCKKCGIQITAKNFWEHTCKKSKYNQATKFLLKRRKQSKIAKKLWRTKWKNRRKK